MVGEHTASQSFRSECDSFFGGEGGGALCVQSGAVAAPACRNMLFSRLRVVAVPCCSLLQFSMSLEVSLSVAASSAVL